jgi:hypothetical protein
MTAQGTRLGTGYVEIRPDFSRFNEALGKKLSQSLAPQMRKLGKQSGKDIAGGIDDGSLRSALQPLLRRFDRFGDDAGKVIASKVGRSSKSASGDMFGLADAVKEVERRSKSTASTSKILSNDMFGIGRAAKSSGKSLLSVSAQLKSWHARANSAEKASKKLGSGIRGLGADIAAVVQKLKVGSGDFSGFNGAMSRINRTFSFFRNILRALKLPAFAAGIGLAAQALSALTAGAVATLSALGPLSGALVALPAAALAAAQGFGVLKLAMAGVGGALQAAFSAEAKGGEQAVDTLRQQQEATERVADAKRGLIVVQRQAKWAQQDLTKARQEATRQLQDMRMAAEGSAETEQQAMLQLRQARRELAKTERDPNSTGLDVVAAEQTVAQAGRGLEETRVEAKRAREDYSKAQKKGVEGMPEVVAAKRAEADANRAVADGQRELVKATREGTEVMKQQGSAASALQQKMAQLPPAAQKFVHFLIALKPRFDELRATAASGFFPGATEGIKALMGNLDGFKATIASTSRVLGSFAAKAGKKLGSAVWGKDLTRIGKMNTRILGRMGDAGLNLADAFRHILVSAQPLLEWMSKGTLKLSEWVKGEAAAGRESGRLSGFFDQTRKTMERLGPIFKGVGGGLLNVGKAARPLGNEILAALGKASEGWRKWTDSMQGQNELRNYFTDAKPAIFEMGRLMRDVTKAFFKLGNQAGAAKMLRLVRTQLLPALTDLVSTLTGAFGEAFVSMLTNLIGLFDQISHGNGPLVLFVKTVSWLSGALTELVKRNPALRVMVTGIVALLTAMKVATLLGAVTGFQRLSGAILGTANAYRALAAGQALSSVAEERGVSATAIAKFGTTSAGKMAMSFGKALGPALAAVGLANIITSATKGDWKDAGFEAGGALAGGIAGAFVGGPLGAMAGAGLGSVAGEMLSGLFKSEKQLTPVQKALAESSQNLARSLRGQKDIAHLTAEAHNNLRNADRKLHKSTAELVDAEHHLDDVRKHHKAGSIEVLRAEAQLHDKRQANKKAANEQRFAEEELAFAKKAQGRSVAQVVHDSNLAIAADRRWIDQIKRRISVEGWSKEATEAAQKATKRLATDEGTRSQALDQARHRNVEWAKSLEEMTLMQDRFGKNGKALVAHIEGLRQKIVDLRHSVGAGGRASSGPLGPLNDSLSEAQTELQASESKLLRFISSTGPKLRTWALQGVHHTERMGGGFESLSGTVGEALQTMANNASSMLQKFGAGKIPKFTVQYLHANSPGSGKKYLGGLPELKQEGGAIGERVGSVAHRLATGGLASMVPGSSTGDRHTLSLNGRPVAKVESKEGIFVGNRNLMGALSQANAAVPRFQKGGVVKGGLMEPKLTGQGGALKELGRSAIHKVFEGAKDFLAKHQGSAGGMTGSGPVEQVFAKVAKALSRSKVATLALGEAGFAESGMRDLGYGDSTSQGALQLLASTASSTGIDPHDEAAVASAFLQTGYTGAGGANKLAAQGLPAQLVAQGVQGSAFSDGSNYLAQEGAAKGWMKRFGLQAGGMIGLAKGGLLTGGLANAPTALRWSGIGSSGLQSGIRNLAAYVMDKYSGLSVSSTTGGTHAANSLHYSGQAVDLASGDYSYMDQAAAWIKSSGLYKSLAEGIHNPNLSVDEGNLVDPSFYADVWSDHRDHIHLGVTHPWTKADASGSAGSATGAEAPKATKEEIPDTYRGAKTGQLDFGPMPKTMEAVKSELGKLQPGEVTTYRKAKQYAEKHGRPEVAQAVGKNLSAIEQRIAALKELSTRLRLSALKKRLKKRLGGAFKKMGGYEQMVELAQRDYEVSAQNAEQIVGLEPQSPELAATATDAQKEAAEKDYVKRYSAYVDGPERVAFSDVLGRVAGWRNTILRAEKFGFGDKRPSVMAMQTGWEGEDREATGKIAHIKAFAQQVTERVADFKKEHKGVALPAKLQKQVAEKAAGLKELPLFQLKDSKLREAIGKAREAFFPGGKNRLEPDATGVPALPLPGSGTLEEQLKDVQGIHVYPDQHELLDQLPAARSAGKFGGIVWDVQSTIEELGIKIRQAANSLGSPSTPDDSERTSMVEELLRQANQGKLVDTLQGGVAKAFENTYPVGFPFAGTFHTGGVTPGPRNAEAVALVRGQERIRTPEQELAMAEAIREQSGGAANGDVVIEQITLDGDGHATVRIGGRDFEQAVRNVVRAQPGTGRITPGGARGF